MEKFHIYEELSRNQTSRLFKGREKHTINLVSVKRVSKDIKKEVSINH